MTDKTKTDSAKGIGNPFAMFQTDEALEAAGVTIDYGAFWFKIARAGGGNKRFARILTAKMKPYRRLIQEDRMPEDMAQKLLHEAVANGIVLDWGSEAHGPGNMIGKDGEAIPFSESALVALFQALPDLFADLYQQANKVALFRAGEEETDAGN